MADLVTVSHREGRYPIVLGSGLLDSLPELLEAHCPAAAYAILTDHAVAELYGARLTRRLAPHTPTHLFSMPAGEVHKTRDTWADLTDRMLDAGIGRDGAVIALGGGVVGDVAGFVAATCHRGIPCVQIPTTLLAMIDSSIGGKTGVDTRFGKNLVGAFHQPRLVVADVDTLSTLPRPQLAAGAAEAVKHGALADADYLSSLATRAHAILAADPDTLRDVVRVSVGIKAAVVEEDEREQGRRALLNLGHTVAHAIEAATGFRYLHGEAVAMGLVAEAGLGQTIGVTDSDVRPTLEAALSAFALPTSLPDPARISPATLLDAMRRDKKNRAGTVHFTFLEHVGRPARTKTGNWTFSVRDDVIESALGNTG